MNSSRDELIAHHVTSSLAVKLNTDIEAQEAQRRIAPASVFSRAVATFEATEAAASVVFRTVASVKAILLRPF